MEQIVLAHFLIHAATCTVNLVRNMIMDGRGLQTSTASFGPVKHLMKEFWRVAQFGSFLFYSMLVNPAFFFWHMRAVTRYIWARGRYGKEKKEDEKRNECEWKRIGKEETKSILSDWWRCSPTRKPALSARFDPCPRPQSGTSSPAVTAAKFDLNCFIFVRKKRFARLERRIEPNS